MGSAPTLRRRLARLALVAGAGLALLLLLLAVIVHHPVLAIELCLESKPTKLPVPVEGIRPRDLRDTWGGPRSGGRLHRGIDIFAPRGTPIHSTTRGIVLRVGVNRLGGNVAWVLGPGAELHYYAHLEGWADIHRGRVVAAGDVLGYVGDSGNAKGTPCHLHYGLYDPPRGAVNPHPRLAP